MGQLLSLVKGRDPVQIFVDFENAKPGSHETDLYERAQAVLSRAPEMLLALEQYKGCQDLARKSMSTPTLANETEAFEGLLEAVDSVNMFFLYSKELEQLVPELLQRLSRETTESTRDSFLEQQCLVRQLADVFNFALCFDQTRMLRPYLSNDFSYYRRLLAKFNKHPAIKVRDDDASGMALFTAEHIPMTTCIARAAAQALERNLHVTHTLSVMANTCVGMLKNTEQPVPDRIKLFLARAATGAIICFDHVDPLGAFHKKSPIRVKRAATLFKKDLPTEPGLLNALRYSTKHFADADAATQAVFQS